MTHKTTTIPKRDAGGTAPTWYGPARDRRNARRPPAPPEPEPIIHLTNAPGDKATACGLRQGSRPYTPYTLARNKAMMDRARVNGNLPPVTWCPRCLAYFGWT